MPDQNQNAVITRENAQKLRSMAKTILQVAQTIPQQMNHLKNTYDTVEFELSEALSKDIKPAVEEFSRAGQAVMRLAYQIAADMAAEATKIDDFLDQK